MATSITKFTMASMKAWVRKNASTLQIQVNSHFDGSVDCVMPTQDKSWVSVTSVDLTDKRTLGIKGAWFVGGTDRLYPVYSGNTNKVESVYVNNCCGSFILKA